MHRRGEPEYCHGAAFGLPLGAILWISAATSGACLAQEAAPLPAGVQAVWDLAKAYREATPTRERVSINGLWRWQPADPQDEQVPDSGWGYFKVPGCWPGITDYMQKDCQTVHPHPGWRDTRLSAVSAAWYQRTIAIPTSWTGRRIAISADTVNSYAAVCVDGHRVGEIRFPAGEVDITAACRPGAEHSLSLLVVAMPLRAVLLSHSDSNSAREVRGSVARRGLCGDVWLTADPRGARLEEIQLDTSLRRREITVNCSLQGLSAEQTCVLRAVIAEQGRTVREFHGRPFRASDLVGGRIALAADWLPDKRWDLHTPQNQYEIAVSLLDATGKLLDAAHPLRFGFREFWIDGRDFYLNGSRILLSALPLDNAQVGAAWATYDGARESLLRLKGFGINAVYTHNYGCEPGSHLGFAEILRAADDVGMLVALSQPHFSQYDWDAEDAERTNGYAAHAEFYVRTAEPHPSVVMYAMSHNATGYNEDMNPDRIDGVRDVRDQWSSRNARRALRAEAIVRSLDPGRIVYHHSSGNLGSLHTSNFYPNWVPIQELSDWFEHWATEGVKPFFSCEYAAPFTWDWAMYRGWYQGRREFGSAAVPWDFCLAEWNAQFLGDEAYRISDQERKNLRWEAAQFRAGRVWHRWDYPHQLGSSDFDERYPVLAAYLTDNWRAFRTWGVSAISPWEHGVYWKLRPGIDRNRRVALPTDWEDLQRPGFSADYLGDRYERMDLAYEPADWIATPAAEAMYRNNGPLLAYLAGKPERFTSKDHNFLPGETVEKQLVVINNSRETVEAACAWSLDTPAAAAGGAGSRRVTVPTGDQQRIPLRFELPADAPPGAYTWKVVVEFGDGQRQEDRFVLHVLPAPAPAVDELASVGKRQARIALFDLHGETRALLAAMGVPCRSVEAGADLSGTDLLIIGKRALTPEGPAPDLGRVRDGLQVIVFEQTAAALEKRLGFRVQEYGLRNVFRRVPEHPCLSGLDSEQLRDWRGESTLLPPRLEYVSGEKYAGVPVVRWCGLEVPRLWRCGNRGTVASVLIEKPAIGDFLPLVDGGFSLQYSPLLEYREGTGRILFCQLDVTGRTESDPAADRLVRNILRQATRVDHPPPPALRAVYVGDPAGQRFLEQAGIRPSAYAGGELAADQLLIAGRGSSGRLAQHREALARWLAAGGRLLALELDADEANAFLPSPVRTAAQEHIAAVFPPPGIRSPFVGIAPADLHNRDPRTIALIGGGAESLAGGVLAQSHDGRVVFCQLAPWSFLESPGDPLPSTAASDEVAEDTTNAASESLGGRTWPEPAADRQDLRKTYRRTSFLLTRLVANLGVRGATPLLDRFAMPVSGGAAQSIAAGADDNPAHNPPASLPQDPAGDDGAGSESPRPAGGKLPVSQGRWTSGLYIDQPQEWDDPYRFFRW